ncbi:Uncharacterised protein [Acinetobacter baumannii]|nr:Uncharacterised protein [Acinetobacter baumannii]
MPLDTHAAGKAQQRLQTALSEFDDPYPFRLEMVAALARQFVQQPHFGLALHQQPAAGEQRRRPVETDVKRDAPPVFGAEPARPETIGRDAARLAHQPAHVLHRHQRHQFAGVGGGDALQRQLIEQPPGHRQHDRMQASFRVFHQQQRPGVRIQLDVALGLQQGGKHAQQDQTHAAAVRLGDHAVDAVQRAPGVLLRFTAAAARPRHLRALLGKVVLEQLLHRRQPLTQLAVGQLLRIAHQLARQLIQLLRQRLRIGFAFIAEAAGAQAANKARVAQAQNRVDADDGVGQLFDMVQLKGVAVGVEKTAPGAHRAVIGQLAFAAVVNAAQAVFPLDPQRRQMAVARQVRVADVFLAEGEYHLQVALFGRLLPGGKMEVVRFKSIQFLLRRQQQRQRIQQAGFTPGVFAEQQRVVVQHQGQPINTAKTYNFDTLQEHPPPPVRAVASSMRRLSQSMVKKPLVGQAASVKSAALLRPGFWLACAPRRRSSRIKTQGHSLHHVFRTVDYSVTADCRLPHSLTPSPAAGADQPPAELDGVCDPVFHGHQPGVYGESQQQSDADLPVQRGVLLLHSLRQSAVAGAAGAAHAVAQQP